MSTVQTNGISPTTSVSTKNNKGTIKSNGLINSNNFVASSLVKQDVDVFASTVIDNDSADKAIDGGIFSFNNQKPIAKKVTSTLSTVNNDYLVSGSSNPGGVQSIHKIESIKTRQFTKAIRENNYNIATAEFEPGYPVISDDNFGIHNALPNGVVDTAANPTRDVPGKLFFRSGSPNTVVDQYAKKTS